MLETFKDDIFGSLYASTGDISRNNTASIHTTLVHAKARRSRANPAPTCCAL